MTKLQRGAEDEEFEAIAEGIEIRTLAKDAMGESRVLHVTIPPDGPGPDMEAFSSALRDLSKGLPRTLEQAVIYIQECAPAEAPEPLSKDEFLASALRAIRAAEAVLITLPEDHRDEVRRALDAAFSAGQAIQAVTMREKHLPAVETEGKMNRSGGGKAKADEYHQHYRPLFEQMYKLIVGKKHSNSRAAAIAREGWIRDGRGDESSTPNADALRKSYKTYLSRRPGGKIGAYSPSSNKFKAP